MHVRRHISTAVLAIVLTAGSAAAANAAAPGATGQPQDGSAPVLSQDPPGATVGDQVPAGVTITPQVQAYLDTLTAEQRTEFVTTKLPASTGETLTDQQPLDATARLSVAVAALTGRQLTRTSTGCWTGRYDGYRKAALGNTLFTYYHVGRWCASGSAVTSASVADAGGETSTPGWRYDGVINRASGVTSNEGRSSSQTRFVLGTGGWDVQTVAPCLRVRGLSNATFTTDQACGIY